MATSVSLYMLLKLIALFSLLFMQPFAHARQQNRSSRRGSEAVLSTLSLPIFYRDPPGPTKSKNITTMLKRDSARVESINGRLNRALHGENEKPSRADGKYFNSPVVSGMSEGSGEFFTTMGIGTPGQQFSLIMDTGSDMTWLQCLPCKSCYEQVGPVFDPASSSSFHPVTCPSDACADTDLMVCSGEACLYGLSYGDGSFSVGNTAREDFLVGSKLVQGVQMGCGHDNEGLFVGSAGLLGLGRGALSFPSQIASKTDGTFSYCLSTTGPGSLVFGGASLTNDEASTFTTLLQNPIPQLSFYYVPLTGISIDGTLVSISASSLSLKPTGAGGVILDSGTSITRLVEPVYVAMRDAFRLAAKGKGYRQVEGTYALFDTCYEAAGMAGTRLPVVELHFQGEARLDLPAANYLLGVDDQMKVVCLAFAPTSGDLSIIGNVQQQGFGISFDTKSARVAFRTHQCS